MSAASATVYGHTIWWIALGIGLVVIVVVALLMALLRSFVADIERGAEALVHSASAIGEQTAAISLLGDTLAGVQEIKEEAVVHLQFLNRVLGS
jgi:hypothetical protein